MLVMEEKSDIRPLLTPADAARILNATEQHIGNLLRSRRLIGVKIGKEWRIDPADLQAYIERNKKR